MTFSRIVFAVALVAASAANAKDLDPQTRDYVIQSCSGDAFRLCPQSLGTQAQALSCMRAKRRELGSVCRVAYEKVVHTLSQ